MQPKGFTLLEILVALLVFTILSLILVGALHNVMQAQEGAERTAERLRNSQILWLILSRDIEQIVNRPVLVDNDKEEAAFLGDDKGFSFTHMGMSGALHLSSLQRVKYAASGNSFIRMAWPVLDRLEKTRATTRELIAPIKSAHFDYFDDQGKAQEKWPKEGEGTTAPLPRAVRIILTTYEGKMSQTYVVPATTSKNGTQQKDEEAHDE